MDVHSFPAHVHIIASEEDSSCTTAQPCKSKTATLDRVTFGVMEEELHSLWIKLRRLSSHGSSAAYSMTTGHIPEMTSIFNMLKVTQEQKSLPAVLIHTATLSLRTILVLDYQHQNQTRVPGFLIRIRRCIYPILDQTSLPAPLMHLVLLYNRATAQDSLRMNT